MAQLKNIHLLNNILKTGDIDKMEYAAVLHKRHSNITFKVIKVDEKKKEVIIQVSQEKSSAENYQDAKRLVEIVHETFGRFFSGWKMNIGAVPYKKSPVEIVDPKWIDRMMNRLHVSVKDMVADTGIEKTQLSALVTGNRPLSQPMKALFFYYMLSKRKSFSKSDKTSAS